MSFPSNKLYPRTLKLCYIRPISLVDYSLLKKNTYIYVYIYIYILVFYKFWDFASVQ